ncbi:hypothetical protein LJC34_04665 [Oscillospiraceae bacterium OttesenSCG-928-G22]|nr:hypothetical protein [Oscillospiraceae bacterium OttesenSCG-928-G22]
MNAPRKKRNFHVLFRQSDENAACFLGDLTKIIPARPQSCRYFSEQEQNGPPMAGKIPV